MMRLLRSWRDSLLLLVPQNLKLFALITLKSTFETYKTFIRVWSLWSFPIILLMYAFINRFPLYKTLSTQMLISFFVAWFIVYTVIICSATRPSIDQKNFDYFSKNGFSYSSDKCMYFLFFYIVSYSIFIVIMHMMKWPHDYVIFITDFIPLWIFFILFYLDSDGSIRQVLVAAVRAVKMTVYNIPLLLLCMVIMLSPALIIAKMVALPTWVEYIAMALYLLVIKIIVINIWTNIYIKRLHEMPDLYFKQPK